MDGGGEPRTAASRLLDVLGAFGVEHAELSLTEIARRARLPLPTAHRLAAALVAWGALERGADGRYRVGLRLWRSPPRSRRDDAAVGGDRRVRLPRLHL
ncbi:IclR-like helix-turn-helix domain-containing protein [Actinocorallia herbida]|uniref:IclR-like helix-turn-helix domain-containing protein n=1 Tax=Actinocorallia herbida TaxID=58109 RepID=A0A3N1D1H1_9ACTN|nr:helix-turn-helix domain-containing protein [Actinocorallia herbida]ROO87340.1 IclR-like helix-turn-helix domain-containing protein [Actinocorallia herbida]